MSTGLGTRRTHRTLRGASGFLPEKLFSWFLTGRVTLEVTGRSLSIRCEQFDQVQLVVGVAPDTLRSASGAISSVSGALVFLWNSSGRPLDLMGSIYTPPSYL